MQILYRPMNGDPSLVAAEPHWASYAGAPLDLDGARSRYVELTRRWAELHGMAEAALVRELDVEDWCESAVRLVAAVDTGLPVHVLMRCRDFREIAFDRSINTDGGFDPHGPSIFTGSFLKQDPVFPYRIRGEDPNPANLVWPDGARHWLGNHYWRDETLMNALGRHARLSTGNSGGTDGYVDVTRRLVGDGADRVLAKIVFQAKYQGPTEIVLPRGADGRPSTGEQDIEAGYFRAFEETLMDCDERQECFLVQEVRPMVAEYRVAVADGRPVAGAGCVEKLSPIFHDPADGPFDPVVEGRRNRGDLERRPDLAARYAGRAAEICAEHAANGVDEFRNCTMDFCLDAETGDVLLVETNAMENFGLYAMDFRPVMAAMVAEAKRTAEPGAPNTAP